MPGYNKASDSDRPGGGGAGSEAAAVAGGGRSAAAAGSTAAPPSVSIGSSAASGAAPPETMVVSWFRALPERWDISASKKNIRPGAVLRFRIRDPMPFWPLDPVSGMGKKTGSGSGMNNPVHISESLEFNFLGYNTQIIWRGTGIRDG